MPHALATLMLYDTWLHNDTFCTSSFARTKKPLIWCYINNKLLWARKYARIVVRRYYLFREANSSPRAKLSGNCELRGTDNVQGQLFVYISEAKSSLLSLLSFKYFLSQRNSQRRETNKTKCETTTSYLGAFWHCFLNKFPNFLISKLKKNAPFRSLFARRGLLAVIGHYRLITSAHERTLLGHVSRFHQSRAMGNIWWIIKSIKYFLAEGVFLTDEEIRKLSEKAVPASTKESTCFASCFVLSCFRAAAFAVRGNIWRIIKTINYFGNMHE